MNKENLSNSKKEEKGVEPMVFFGPVERTILEKGYVPAMDFYNENENCCNEEEYRPYVEKLWRDSSASKEINNLDNTDIIAEECNNIKSDKGGLIKETNLYMESKNDIPTFNDGPNVNGMITLPGNVDENNGVDKINVLSLTSDFIKSESVRTIGDKDIYVYNNRFYEKVSEMTLKRKIMRRYEHKLKAHGRTYVVNEILNAILMNLHINMRELIVDAERVSFEKCVLNIRTGRKEMHSPNNFITYGVNGKYLDHEPTPKS